MGKEIYRMTLTRTAVKDDGKPDTDRCVEITSEAQITDEERESFKHTGVGGDFIMMHLFDTMVGVVKKEFIQKIVMNPGKGPVKRDVPILKEPEVEDEDEDDTRYDADEGLTGCYNGTQMCNGRPFKDGETLIDRLSGYKLHQYATYTTFRAEIFRMVRDLCPKEWRFGQGVFNVCLWLREVINIDIDIERVKGEDRCDDPFYHSERSDKFVKNFYENLYDGNCKLRPMWESLRFDGSDE